jgi:glycosyltransferase involved in cell wall biosynthesis
MDQPLKICWLGGALYRRPLDPTQEKKFRELTVLGELTVIGSAHNFHFSRFHQHANFYLLPRPRSPLLRYLITYPLATILVAWLALRKDVSVFIGQSPYESLPAAIMKRSATIWGKRLKLIVESHGDFEKFFFLQRRVRFPGFYRWFIHASAQYVFRHADALRSISNSTERQLAAWAPSKPVTRFATWTDIDTFLSTRRETRPSESNVIIYAGVLVPGKAVHVLIEAFARVVHVHRAANLVLVGRPENREYAAELREQVESLDLEDRVTFREEVPQQELARYFASARALVLPSTSEALGRVIIEAMACAAPVVGSSVGGIPDLIEDGVNGYLVPPGDVETLSDCILRLFSSDAVDAMGERGRETARRMFSTESYVEGYRRLIGLALDKVGKKVAN